MINDRNLILISLDKADAFIRDIKRCLHQLNSLIPNDFTSQLLHEKLWNQLRINCFGLAKTSDTFELELRKYSHFDPQWSNLLSVRRRLVDSLGRIILSGSTKQIDLWMLAWRSTQDTLDFEMIEVKRNLSNNSEFHKVNLNNDDKFSQDTTFNKRADTEDTVLTDNNSLFSNNGSNLFSSSINLFPS